MNEETKENHTGLTEDLDNLSLDENEETADKVS